MQTIKSILDMRCAIEAFCGQNKKIALVPTMGNLHQGHLSLIQQAQILVDKVVVSIFCESHAIWAK